MGNVTPLPALRTAGLITLFRVLHLLLTCERQYTNVEPPNNGYNVLITVEAAGRFGGGATAGSLQADFGWDP